MRISNEEIEQQPNLPKPSRSKEERESGLPPASSDKLISSGSRFNRERRQKELEEMEKKKEDEEKPPEEKKIQIEFMKPNGSFVFQTLMEFHQVYSIVYFIIEELMFIYKCHFFQYQSYAAGFEITGLILYLFVQFGRFYFGSLGNRAEASIFVLFCLIFSVGAVYTYAHYMLLQTYVLRIELLTGSIGLFLWLLEVIFAVTSVIP